MTIAIIVGVCIILLILGFLLPRASWWPQKGVDKTFGTGQRTASKLPGKAGDLAEKPFRDLAQGRQQERAEGTRGPLQDAHLTWAKSRYSPTRNPGPARPIGSRSCSATGART